MGQRRCFEHFKYDIHAYLIGHRKDFGGCQQDLEVLDGKIADPDAPTENVKIGKRTSCTNEAYLTNPFALISSICFQAVGMSGTARRGLCIRYRSMYDTPSYKENGR